VAAGSHIYIYRNLRPYYKFVLPPEDVNEEEQDCWWVKQPCAQGSHTGGSLVMRSLRLAPCRQKMMAGEMVVGDGVAILTRLQDSGVILTTRSLQIMNIGQCLLARLPSNAITARESMLHSPANKTHDGQLRFYSCRSED
jgi:Bardet-Biedl syndrome 1 protein